MEGSPSLAKHETGWLNGQTFTTYSVGSQKSTLSEAPQQEDLSSSLCPRGVLQLHPPMSASLSPLSHDIHMSLLLMRH